MRPIWRPKLLTFASFCWWSSSMRILLVDGAVSLSRIVRKFLESRFAFLVSCQFCLIEKAEHRFIRRKRSFKNIILNCSYISDFLLIKLILTGLFYIRAAWILMFTTIRVSLEKPSGWTAAEIVTEAVNYVSWRFRRTIVFNCHLYE